MNSTCYFVMYCVLETLFVDYFGAVLVFFGCLKMNCESTIFPFTNSRLPLEKLSVHEQNSIRTMQNSVLSNNKLNICIKDIDVGKTKYIWFHPFTTT